MKFPCCESSSCRSQLRWEVARWLSWTTAALACLAGSLTTARAQISNVIPVNQVWKYMVTQYDTNFCLNGSGWETPGYDDSPWPSGPGGFTGGENTSNTLFTLTGLLNTTTLPPPSLSSGRPQYFRTHFTLASTNSLSLILSNRIDDQAVFYINGTRVADYRHPTNPETCTPGGAGGDEATTWIVITLTTDQLGGIIRTGDNVLAASAHQNAATSGDMVFVCALSSSTNAMPLLPPSVGPIPFGASGSTNFTFDAAPPVQQWSTRTWAGSATSIPDLAALDTAARTNDAALIFSPLPSATGNPPVAATAATVWASEGHYLQTRPAGVASAGLMATLTNVTASAINGLGISYTLTVVSPAVEEVQGHLVYYSLTGAAGSWVQIPELSNQPTDSTAGAYPRRACVALNASWNPGQLLYFLWVDDNAFSVDPALQIDNVQFSGPSPHPPLGLFNHTDPTNRTVIQCQSTTLSAPVDMDCGGPTPLLQWFKDDLAIPGETNASYTIANMQEADAGRYFLRVTSPVTNGTTNSHTATVSFQAAPAFALIRALANLTNPSEIRLSFNLPVDANTIDGSTFTVQTRSGDLVLNLFTALITNSTNVVITTDPREDDIYYDLVVNDPGPASICPGTHVIGTYPLYRAESRLDLTPPDGVGDMFLSWGSGILQQAASPAGPWSDVSPTPSNPSRINVGDATNRFYRVR